MTTEHPLLRPFPLTVMTLASFLVVFTLLMAKVGAGAGPVMRANVSRLEAQRGAGGEAVTTRASGAPTTALPVATRVPATSSTPALLTRSSGAYATGGGDD